MNEISKARFVWSLVLITIGFGLYLVPYGMAFGGPLIYVSIFILMGRQRARAALNRPIRRADVIWMVVVWGGFAAIAMGDHYFLSDRGGAFLVRLMRHPAFVISLWAIAFWINYRRWKRRPHISIGPPLVYRDLAKLP